jgi:hypothetical protein
MGFNLNGKNKIDWTRPNGCPSGFDPLEVVSGNAGVGGMAIEIAVASWTKSDQPTREALTKLHSIRVNKRATPVVLLIELQNGRAIVFGPNPASAPIGPLEAEQTERVIQASLDEPTVIAARTRLAGLMQSIDSTSMPGIKNSGLFANHELRVGVPQRADWQTACETSNDLLSTKGNQLIEKLGFSSGRAGAHALLLTGSGPRPEAIAVMLDEREAFDAESNRFAVSPVAYGLKMADQQGVPWLIMLRGTQLRLYPARIEFGVGRKGLAETFFEVDLPQLTRENSGYVNLIFSAAALAEGGSAYEILKSSAQYAVELGVRLRDKVYEEIIPDLSLAVADALVELDYEMDAEGLDLAYQLTLRVFFRMLFQVYAEDRKLLPFGENTKYDRNAIKTVAKDLVDHPDQEFDSDSTSLWDDLAQVWRVIDSGDRAWGVPAYNGGLFSSDKELNPHGAILKDVHITNDVMGPVLKALLLDEDDDGEVGQVDFRSLSVREFGTIYEGLLESSLGLAEVDLTLDKENTWVPAKKNDEVYAYAGQVYFHNTSGQRKGTGSYFTPSFVVEHLLERSLDPALDTHLEQVAERLSTGDQSGAAELFFDFKVADLAMGSGHFLTAAIDHIEQKMAAFLAEDGHYIPGVASELLKLENAAKGALGPDAPDPERSSLLRRQIARRCIYGLDINPIAVELARVSIWIHTFVRGLPMSSLDHNLVCANSLTGIGSVDEALDVLVPGRKGSLTLFDAPIEDALNSARTTLVDAALLAEATKEETREASRAAKRALKEAEKARLLFDAAVLTRIGQSHLVNASDPEAIARLAAKDSAQSAISPLKTAHMPYLFPEVFLRKNGGFDVLVGNPPWEKLKVEEHQWWGLRYPGLRGQPMAARTRRIEELKNSRADLREEFERNVEENDAVRRVLTSGTFKGIGAGDPDLYVAFSWRNWQLLRVGGKLAVVMPRNSLSGSSTQLWRREIAELGAFENVIVGINSRGWLFPEIHHQYLIGLIVVAKDQNAENFSFVGPISSYSNFLENRDKLFTISKNEFASWSDTYSFPLFGPVSSGEIYRVFRQSPKFKELKQFEFRRIREVESADKKYFDFDLENPASDVKVLTGSSINLMNPDFGGPYAYLKKDAVKALLEKLKKSSRISRSSFFGIPISSVEDLPMYRPRIAIRDITNSVDHRTLIACLLPPGVTAVETLPTLLRRKGDNADEAFLLGVLTSIPCDWFARTAVSLHVTLEVLNEIPIPESKPDDSRRVRIVEIAGRMAAKDSRYREWAASLGIEAPCIVSELELSDLEAELDANVASLYGLSREQLIHVFTTFHRTTDYSERMNRALVYFDRLGNGN